MHVIIQVIFKFADSLIHFYRRSNIFFKLLL